MDIMEQYLLSKSYFLQCLCVLKIEIIRCIIRGISLNPFLFSCLVKTVFSGQTGSGKTFTMLGKNELFILLKVL